MNYEKALDYLSGLGKFGIHLGLSRILELLKRMGNPQNQFKSIHITGTNGKGSTTAMVASILTKSGLKTGMYTSPHLMEYTERMVIDGVWISREDFAGAIEKVSRYVEEMNREGLEHPTEFEVLTAAAFYYFASKQVDYAVIEVGLGGLLDSTNVIDPEVSIITNVTLEHTDRCGSTIEEIATHKAGIIKDRKPVITAAEGKALAVIQEVSADRKSSLYVWGRDFSGCFKELQEGLQNIELEVKAAGIRDSFLMGLLGHHQVKNAGLAVTAALVLAESQPAIQLETIKEGLRCAVWPGRFEVVSRQPMIIVDGAHNRDGARALRESLDAFYPEKNRVFLLGILRDKDQRGIIEQLIRREDRVVVTAPLSERAESPEHLAKEIHAGQVEVVASIEEGVKRAREITGEEELLCIAGSLYLIGFVRTMI